MSPELWWCSCKSRRVDGLVDTHCGSGVSCLALSRLVDDHRGQRILLTVGGQTNGYSTVCPLGDGIVRHEEGARLLVMVSFSTQLNPRR